MGREIAETPEELLGVCMYVCMRLSISVVSEQSLRGAAASLSIQRCPVTFRELP